MNIIIAILAGVGTVTTIGGVLACIVIAFGARRARQMMQPYADEHQGMV